MDSRRTGPLTRSHGSAADDTPAEDNTASRGLNPPAGEDLQSEAQDEGLVAAEGTTTTTSQTVSGPTEDQSVTVDKQDAELVRRVEAADRRLHTQMLQQRARKAEVAVAEGN